MGVATSPQQPSDHSLLLRDCLKTGGDEDEDEDKDQDEDEDEDEDGLEALRTLVGSFWRIFCFCRNLGFGVEMRLGLVQKYNMGCPI